MVEVRKIEITMETNGRPICTLQLTKPESAYVTKTIRDLDASRHRKG